MAEPSSPSGAEEGDPPHTNGESEGQASKEEELSKAVAALIEKGKTLQDTAAKYSGRLKTEGDALGEQAISLEKEIKSLFKELNNAVEADQITNELAEELEVELYRARGMVYEGDVAALLPHKANGYFLSLFLGHVNVRSVRRDIRFKVKEEYNSYRDRTAVLFLAFPAVLRALKHFAWKGCFVAFPVHAYQAWLLFFYTSLALRENILRINGSDIRPWWIHHHYYAMLMALVTLTWSIEGPNCEEKQTGVNLFLAWAIMQGVAMLLQNHYQRQRLYTRIALGKAGRMDVVWGETAGVKGQLWLLYPLLFVLQGFQFYIGLELLRNAFFQDTEWQVAVSGILLVIMAVGNFTNTVGTVIAKNRFKARMKKQGRQMLERMSSRSLSMGKGKSE